MPKTILPIGDSTAGPASQGQYTDERKARMSDYYRDPIATLPLFSAPARAPAQQHSVTSLRAADSLDGDRLNTLQRSVVAFLRSKGDHGATDEEMQLGIPMAASTQRPRRIELVRRGLVVEAGTRKARSGRYATAWRLA